MLKTIMIHHTQQMLDRPTTYM